MSSNGSRTVWQILRANLLTRFNAILGVLLVAVLVIGPLQDALFGLVLAVNATVGIVEELRAKRTLDTLTLLSAPRAHAVRDGRHVDVLTEEVMVGDLLELWPGDQVVADGEMLGGASLEVDESLLSGESAPVTKEAGDVVLSGSSILSGRGSMVVTRTGDRAFAGKLERDARRFDLVRSELRGAANEILRLISWAMAPLGVLLATSQLLRAHQSAADALRGTVAGIGAMVPEGLVLLTTVAFAAGAVRLARRRVLVNELAAVEGLARVDVLCIDKTGTLTEPGLRLRGVEGVGTLPTRDALGAMAAEEPSPNATTLAARDLPVPRGWRAVQSISFSSQRRWSAVEFAGRGSWVMGAPDAVMPSLDAASARRIDDLAASGRRVVLVAHSPRPLLDDALPSGLERAGWAVFEERLRPDAAHTIGFLRRQGVRVLVVSGDDPQTAAAVAARAGIAGTAPPIHADSLPETGPELADAVGEASVIGRVRPYQKRDIVRALQARGHVVAMTGDGVNDVPALKAADLGIAMGTGSAAARAVGRVVLLGSDFSAVPLVLDEGRRVIANVERVARLFVTKTIYAALLALVVGAWAVPYPFFPRHFTLVSTLTIGVPGFVLAFAPGAPGARPAFLHRLLRFCVPAGAVAASATLATYVLARSGLGASLPATRTTATGTLFVVGIAVLVLASTPLRPLRVGVVAAMAGAGGLAIALPFTRTLFGLVWPPSSAAITGLSVSAIAIVVLVVAERLFVPSSCRRSADLGPPDPAREAAR